MIKKGNGEGSVFQRADGRWVAALQVGVKTNGTADIRRKYAKSEAEAKRKLREMKKTAYQEIPEQRKKQTVEQYMWAWFQRYKRKLKPAGYDRQEETIKYEAEAKPKEKWEAEQRAKRAADEQAIAALTAMSDADVIGASVKRTGADLERLTRRNMKTSVTQYVQALCKCDPALARLTMHPRKSMINCFRYINRKAREYLKQEMEALDEKPEGNGYGGDVPDDLCYQWAVDYFRDPDAEEDKEKEEKFVPKQYFGGGKSSKPKKEPKPKPEPKKKPEPPKPEQGQMTLFGGMENAAA